MGKLIFDQSSDRNQRPVPGSRRWEMSHETVGNNLWRKAWKTKPWKDEST